MRRITDPEKPLISWLLLAAGRNEQVEDLTVSEMDDGGMGNMTFGPAHEKRRFGQTIADCQFVDKDGVTVIASLNTDEKGQLYELDVWKVDFNPLLVWPKISDITETTPNPSFERTVFGGR
ncbi:hypothetical protein GmRootA79_29280 [Acidovorax sp. A79]|uniref:DUF6984 family protein n=1 Tax=Acidovorax sp. A79 TaxID=3056107 RepID=UPI0034E8679F